MGLINWLGKNLGFGNILDAGISIWNGKQNRDMQKYMASNSISLRVADAKRAGIHPLAALGAQTFNPSPVGVNTDFGRMGQTPGQAQNLATQTKLLEEKIKTEKVMQGKISADTQAIINSLNPAAVPNPSFGVPQPQSFGNGQLPQQGGQMFTVHQPKQLPGSITFGIEGGGEPTYKFTATQSGRLRMMPTKDVQEAMSEGPPLSQLKTAVAQAIEYFKAIHANVRPKHELSQRTLNVFRAVQRAAEQEYPSKPGYQWRFDTLEHNWVNVPMNGQSRVFNLNFRGSARRTGKTLFNPFRRFNKGKPWKGGNIWNE